LILKNRFILRFCMKIILVRHAKAYESSEDPQRNLTEEGKKEAQIIRTFIQKTRWQFKEILTSPILRAKQTAQILNQEFKIPIEEKLELKPNSALFHFNELLSKYQMNDSLIFVLHMPDIVEIASEILKIPSNNLFFSTGSAIGINITNTNPLDGILIFHYQPNYLE